MKRTISLVIAIAVMISMFIVPASAESKSWHHCIDSVNGATSGSNGMGVSVAVSNMSGYTGVKGSTFSFVGWVQPDAGQVVEKFVVSKDGGANFIDTVYSTTDRSNEMARLVGFNVELTTAGQEAKEYYDVIGVQIDGVVYELIDFTYTLVEQGTISSASQIVPGETVLTQDITGNLTVSSGTYVIDLAGHTWRHNDVPLNVMGTADVTIIDSVGGGMIDSYTNDGPYVYEGAKLTIDGIKVSADGGGMDALFVKGGTLIVKNSTLVASKACINLSQDITSTPTVIVENTTFEVYNGSQDKGRICAFEFRNNITKVKLVGNNVFNNATVLRRDVAEGKSPADVTSLFTYGDNASATFSADGALIQSRWTPNTINYTYTAPVETKLGASIEITNGIALDFVVSNAPANAVVKIDGVEFGASYVDGQDSHYILDGFGPHTMGDEHTAELYVDGELFATKTYSVKEYCLDVINGAAINDAHKALAKEILNYGAKAQVYVDYDAENLVNDGVVSEGTYVAADDVALILNDFAGASANWVNANVKFGDTLELIINLEGDADKVVVTIGTESTTYEVLTTASGAKYIVVTDITPDQFKTEIAAVAYNGDVKVSKTLVYSVGSYINDRVENSTNEAYVELVKALSIYGDAVAAFVA